jgi:thioredoxin reductase
MFETIVLGGGVAGLQAALTLGRMHRRTLLLDSGEYRNATVRSAHNLLTNDGRDPAELRRIARSEIAAYETVEVRDDAATAVVASGDGFVVTAGGGALSTRTVILATGMRDTLPDIPGLAEAWGTEVAHCPFCHGHEFAGQDVALLVEEPHAGMFAAMLGPIVASSRQIAPSRVREVQRIPGGLRLILEDERLEVGGVFVAPTLTQRAPFAAQLGLALHPSGAIAIDPMGLTSAIGVYAAGDLAHTDAYPGPQASLAAAIAAGQLAAVGVVRSFVAAESA